MREYVLYVKERDRTASAHITPVYEVDQQFWAEQEGSRLHIIGRSRSLALIFALREKVNQQLKDVRNEDGLPENKWLDKTLDRAKKAAGDYTKEVNRLYVRETRETGYGNTVCFQMDIQQTEKALGQSCRDFKRSIQEHEEYKLESESKSNNQLLTQNLVDQCATFIETHVKGRALLLEETKKWLEQAPHLETGWIAGFQRLVLLEKAEWKPSVRLEVKRSAWKNQLLFTCERCSSQATIDKVECYTCGQACAYCFNCLSMGRCKCCVPLVCIPNGDKLSLSLHANLPTRPISQLNTLATRLSPPATLASLEQQEGPLHMHAEDNVYLRWKGNFSPRQASVAEQARSFVTSVSPSFLIWAVCGAGKTELIFPAMEEILQLGGNVCIATPRKDVVLELAPRIAQVFPTISVLAIHGSSLQKWENSRIVISTTHQMLRNYQRFHLIIIDEVDAFPYHGDQMLYHAVKRSLVPGGKTLYLSATPPTYLQKQLVQFGDMTTRSGCFLRRKTNYSSLPLSSQSHAILPARYHGFPLPVPRVERISRLRYKLEKQLPIPPLLELCNDSLRENRQIFLFVARIEMIPVVLTYLRKHFPDFVGQIEGVHAADPEREHKVKAFRQKEYIMLVTTTILERGVTIPRSDCVVLEAEAAIFDEASLVQIAGRVGRSADSPDGDVLFLVGQKATAPRKAIRQIQRMNKLGSL
ncbi:DEAD/DEAH box helicase [Brevibacillus daliensis]|uniref:DEAD/DEAH box helicase n=1 Tax=Brevibacillus daliensis TaxID=2892995 RepID=UPI001E48D829|nr:helicase-related protein [Brevibacillus daliensis]